MPTPNALAYLMLLLVWPVVGVFLWKRLEPGLALIWTILGGYLILPMLTSVNLPVLPDLDKATIPNIAAWVGARFVRGDKIRWLPESLTARLLLFLFLLSPVGTVLTNGDVAFQPGILLPGIPFTDVAALVIGKAIDIVPFLLARHYLGSDQGNREVAAALVTAGLVYSLPIMLESLLSPQLHRWVYGFHQHDFFQTMRQGGFRPMVFLEHGLWVAFLTLMAMLSALVAVKTASSAEKPKALAVFLYLAVMLALCKSAGVLVYAALAVPLILFAGLRTQLLVAAVLAVLVTAYPILRGAHLVPVDWIIETARGYSADRAGSLAFRLENEELLLRHAQERPWFGWGGYERNLLHDPFTGEQATIADGGWIIALGKLGWAGYAAFFGLAALPLWVLGRRALGRRLAGVSRPTAGLALILALSLVDLLPNATHVPFTWLITGALLGAAERLGRAALPVTAEKPALRPRKTVI